MKYDAIIIGGGLSGLTAGAFLSRKGKKVLVLEKHTTVGGHAAGFWKKGYFFDSGVINMLDSYIEGILEELGIMEDLDIREAKMTMRLIGQYSCPLNGEDFFQQISELFIEDKENILALYESIKDGFELVEKMKKTGNPFSYKGFKKIKRILKYIAIMIGGGAKIMKKYNIPAMEFIDGFFPKGSQARDYFINISYESITLFMFQSLLMSGLEHRYPYRGFQGFSDKIASIIIENNGEIKTDCAVKKIHFNEKKEAIGVTAIERDKEIYYKGTNIISAMDLKKIFFDIIGEEYLDDDFTDRLKRQKMSESFPIMYLGLNIAPEKIREYFKGSENLLYKSSLTRPKKDKNNKDFYKKADIALFSSVLLNPDHAPKGKTNLFVNLSSAPEGWMDNWGIVSGKRTEKYSKIKKMVIEQVLSLLEKIIPNIKDRRVIEVCELGTPFTIEHFTGNTNGSSSGFSWKKEDCLIHGSSNHSPMDYFTSYPSLKNLYFIGHQTVINGGVPGAMMTGKDIVNKIK